MVHRRVGGGALQRLVEHHDAAGTYADFLLFLCAELALFWNHGAYQTVSVFGHFWSLAVEEQFYLVWPLIIWLLPEGWILLLCTVGLVMALPLRFYMVHHYAESLGAMVMTTSRMDGLLIGVILAILLRRGQIPLRWIYLALGLGGGIFGYIAVFHHRELIDTQFYMPTLGSPHLRCCPAGCWRCRSIAFRGCNMFFAQGGCEPWESTVTECTSITFLCT